MSGTQSSHLIEAMAEIGGDVISIDSVTDLSTWDRIGGLKAMSIQGNLDPHLLLADGSTVTAAADRIPPPSMVMRVIFSISVTASSKKPIHNKLSTSLNMFITPPNPQLT